MAKTNQETENLTIVVPKSYREEIRHAKCGGVYVAHSTDEILADDEDCPICTDIRRVAKESQHRNIPVSVGTPLAEEMGAEFSTAKVGPVAG